MTISTVGEKAHAFVPLPLPPHPPIEWTPELHSKFDQALLALGRLDSVATLLPETALFLYMYVRKEAVLSSMIEGTQSSLSDLLLFELDQEPVASGGSMPGRRACASLTRASTQPQSHWHPPAERRRGPEWHGGNSRAPPVGGSGRPLPRLYCHE